MPTNKKTISSYNNFAAKWADSIRSKKNLAHEYLEKPAMYSLLPNLKNKNILCIGCGTGEECAHLKSLGANRVVGVDISKNLIDFAKNSYPKLEFFVQDMEKIGFPKSSFDFVYSSLTMHYVPKWQKTLKIVHEVLKPGGIFQFSTHHPVKWGGKITRGKEESSFLLGYSLKKNWSSYEVFGDYLNTQKQNDIWFDELKITYYHRPLSEILREIRQSPFELIDFIEPKAIQAVKKINPGWWDINQKIPQHMIFLLKNEP